MKILVKRECVQEHVAHVTHVSCFPNGNILIERRGAQEHSMERHRVTNIPSIERFIECLLPLEHYGKVVDLGYTPIPDFSVLHDHFIFVPSKISVNCVDKLALGFKTFSGVDCETACVSGWRATASSCGEGSYEESTCTGEKEFHCCCFVVCLVKQIDQHLSNCFLSCGRAVFSVVHLRWCVTTNNVSEKSVVLLVLHSVLTVNLFSTPQKVRWAHQCCCVITKSS